MADGRQCQDIIVHRHCVASKCKHAFDTLEDEAIALFSLARVFDVMRQPFGGHGRAHAPSPSISRSNCSSMMSLHRSMHSSQINTCGPATSAFTSCSVLPQKEQ